ncbi:MFS transporter [Actinoplanes sp. NPDC051411]|uniref:MFS transporter n=1 Tax=Actinoplanes sp. NPDC051411 TaxID=3155522 RepID=UPI0034301E4E
MWTRAFATYWSATSVSNLGSGVSVVALPTLAALQLHAGAAELGYLRALEAAPYLLFALVVGHLADRWRPLHLMIAADVVRALLLGGVVALATTGRLNLAVLYASAFALGAFTVTYDIAQFTVMPSLVAERAMVPANSAVELARGAAFTFGPGLGGLLTALLRAAPSLIADAGSYVFSAVALSTLRRPVAVRPREQEAGRPTDGLRFLARHGQLRAMTQYLGVNNVCNQAFLTGLIAYLEVAEHSSAISVGLAFGAYGAGFLVAAALATPLRQWWGAAVNVIGSSLLSGAGIAVLAVGAALRLGPVAVMVGAFLVGFAAPAFNVQSVALRLSVTPPELLGRVNAVVKLVSQGSLPLGALAAGGLFSVLSPATAFAVVATASVLATAILILSPVRRLR